MPPKVWDSGILLQVLSPCLLDCCSCLLTSPLATGRLFLATSCCPLSPPEYCSYPPTSAPWPLRSLVATPCRLLSPLDGCSCLLTSLLASVCLVTFFSSPTSQE